MDNVEPLGARALLEEGRNLFGEFMDSSHFQFNSSAFKWSLNCLFLILSAIAAILLAETDTYTSETITQTEHICPQVNFVHDIISQQTSHK